MDYILAGIIIFGGLLFRNIITYFKYKHSLTFVIQFVYSLPVAIIVYAGFIVGKLGFSEPIVLIPIIIGLTADNLVVLFIKKRVAEPATLIAEGARRFSLGDFKLEGMDFEKIGKINSRKDEFGETGRAFSNLIGYLQDKAKTSDEISNGNLDVAVNIASEDDELGHSMEKVAGNTLYYIAGCKHETY